MKIYKLIIKMSYSNGLLPSSSTTTSPQRGLPGVGFELTDDGNYDIDGKRLTNVAEPVDGKDATTKAYVDGKTGHNTSNLYHLRQSFEFYDSSSVKLALSTDKITGLLSDYQHGYYKISKDSDESTYSKVSIEIKNNLPNSTYSALFYLYGYNNKSIITGDDLGPILFGARGINYHVLQYTDDDDSLQTKNHTKGLIWFTADGDGSIEIELRFFDKSITHFVVLSRCVEGKVNLGFSIDIFNVAHDNSGTFYFEDINMNNRKIKNLGDPTDVGDATNKKYVDAEIANVNFDATPLLPRDGSRSMTGDLDMDDNHILSVENLDDYKDTDPYEYRVKDVKSVVNKEYLNENFLEKVDENGREYYDLKQITIKNAVTVLSGNYDANSLITKAYVDNEISKLPKPDTDVLKLDGSKAMTGNLDMGDHAIVGIRGSAVDNAALTVGGAKATYFPLLGNRSMQGNLNMGGFAIKNIKPFVENDSSQAAYDAQKNEVINFGYFHTERGELKRLINNVSSDALNRKNPDPMEDNINMAQHSIINLKDPKSSDASYAASVNFVHTTINGSNAIINGVIDKKIQESEERSIRAVQQENVFKKVMDDGLFILDDDDIHKVAVIDKDFHKVNQQIYQFKIDYDSSIGYYSTRIGVNIVYLPIGYYTIVFEMYFSNKIDVDKITINASSGTLSVNKINTKPSSNHTRSVINFYKAMIHHSDDELDIDISLKNKTGQSYEFDTNIFVVVYGVAGSQNDVDVELWDRYIYINNKKINFEAPIDMVDKDIENVNNLSINNELNMNNKPIKNVGDGNDNGDAVNVKQLNEIETNVTNYVTGEFGKVNPVLNNNSDLIKFIYKNLIRNHSKSFLIKELYFPDSVEGRTQNNYTYQTNGDNKGDVTFYLTFVHKATTSDNMMIGLHWGGDIHSIHIFISEDRVVVSINPLINEPSLTSYRIPSYYKGKQLYIWITIQNNVIKFFFSGLSRAISATHPNLLNNDEILLGINVSDSPFTIQRGLMTKNIYDQNSDAYKDVREYEISEGTFIGPS